jgi:hypothetical protein
MGVVLVFPQGIVAINPATTDQHFHLTNQHPTHTRMSGSTQGLSADRRSRHPEIGRGALATTPQPGAWMVRSWHLPPSKPVDDEAASAGHSNAARADRLRGMNCGRQRGVEGDDATEMRDAFDPKPAATR